VSPGVVRPIDVHWTGLRMARRASQYELEKSPYGAYCLPLKGNTVSGIHAHARLDLGDPETVVRYQSVE
jgi:hypothetical protein